MCMRTVKQSMQDNFKCIADKCPCTCCSGWQIVIDEASLDKYDACTGTVGDMLNSSVDWLEGAFMQKENRDCAFLNSNGLCDLITEGGEEMLCDTCRLYPRHVEEYEDLREWSLSLSCPEAARMLTSLTDYMEFDIVDDDEEDPLEDEFEDFDFILFSKLQDARDLIFDIIRDEDIPFEKAVALIIEFAKQLQESYDSGDYFTMDDIIESFSDVTARNSMDLSFSVSDFIRNNSGVLDDLERLSDDWDEVLVLLKFLPAKITSEDDEFLDGVSQKQHMLILKNMLISLIYIYFQGSIYTGMIYGVTLMCIFACLLVDTLGRCLAVSCNRAVTLSEYEELLYKYSRETEHSDLNINALLEYFDL